ncbi:MAG TPA: DCC1-like thiol-disulfide oxidoreductase family protein [Phototrophicaceae bacterium]|nr:DCC1-like thiol-disulfide oxidoreductase family protein [Phototrophicaceae bacterium]
MNVLKVWERYWFPPASLFNLAVTRLIVVGFQVFWLLVSGHHTALMLRATTPDFLYQPLPVLRLLTLGTGLRPSASLLSLIFMLTIVAGVAALIGFKTNYTLFGFAVGALFMQAFLYSFGEFHHPEAIMMIALVALAFSPCGAVLSVDDLMRRQKQNAAESQFQPALVTQEQSRLALWPLRLVQWLFVLIYLSATISKMTTGAGHLDWMNGYTLQYYMLQDGLRWGSPLGVWLSQSTGLAVILSCVSIIFELTFFLVVLFPQLVWFYIPFGVLFHTSIYLIQRAPFFTFLALYAVFIPWNRVAEHFQRSAPTRKPAIFFDGRCPLCIRSMTTLNYFDWGERLEYYALETHWSRLHMLHPEITLAAGLQEMHILLPDNTICTGYQAFREIWKRLPAFWPLVILTYLPLASAIGPQVYRWIADRRTRFPDECATGVCMIHSPLNK